MIEMPLAASLTSATVAKFGQRPGEEVPRRHRRPRVRRLGVGIADIVGEVEDAPGKPLLVHAVGEDGHVERIEADRRIFRLPWHAAADLAVGTGRAQPELARDDDHLRRELEPELHGPAVDRRTVGGTEEKAGAGLCRQDGGQHRRQRGEDRPAGLPVGSVRHDGAPPPHGCRESNPRCRAVNPRLTGDDQTSLFTRRGGSWVKPPKLPRACGRACRVSSPRRSLENRPPRHQRA